jgi:CRISPR-associated RAMP protein (TIGR02581 family)
MLKYILNEASLTVRITTTGPLLIKSGNATVSGYNMTPVLTFRNDQQEVFIPGSSLKGAFRSHIERVVGTLKARVICFPFSVKADNEADQEQRRRKYRESCGKMFNEIAGKNDDGLGEKRSKRLDACKDLIYAASCPTCRLFGSTSFIGRIAISDAYLASGTREIKEPRDGVGIDRLTGGASYRAKFDMEVVSTGVIFETDIRLRNFELWQLGMLFIVLQDMEDELIPLGSGRSRGLGKVKTEIVLQDRPARPGGVVISTIRGVDPSEAPEEIWGLGKWLDDGSNDRALKKDTLLGLSFPGDGYYGTWSDDLLALEPAVEHSPRGIRLQRVFKEDALTALRAGTIEKFIRRVKEWPVQPQREVVDEVRHS